MPAHSTLTGADLHEPKGAAAANADEIFIADGAGSGVFAAVPVQLPPGTDVATLGQVYTADGAGGGAYASPNLTPQTEHISIQNANFGSGSTAPTQSIVGDYNGWSFGISDDSVFNLELPHNMDATENIEVHLTWAINEAFATSSGEIQWSIDWSLVNHDVTEALNTPNHTGTVASGDINIPATAYYVTHTVLVIAAANVADLDTLGVTLSRVALDGGANPAVEPIIIAAHVEYTTDGT